MVVGVGARKLGDPRSSAQRGRDEGPVERSPRSGAPGRVYRLLDTWHEAQGAFVLVVREQQHYVLIRLREMSLRSFKRVAYWPTGHFL